MPRLVDAPARAAWTISVKPKQAAPPAVSAVDQRYYKAHPPLVSIDVTKAPGKRREIEHYADGSQTVRWIVDDILTTDVRDHTLQTATAAQMKVNFKDEFYQLAWINRADYQGHQTVGQDDCWVYKGQAGSG
ncbi:MAG: hypothetical protein WDO13_19105 [Verrucomicrobiota bacterium]